MVPSIVKVALPCVLRLSPCALCLLQSDSLYCAKLPPHTWLHDRQMGVVIPFPCSHGGLATACGAWTGAQCGASGALPAASGVMLRCSNGVCEESAWCACIHTAHATLPLLPMPCLLCSSAGAASAPDDVLWLMARAGYKPVIDSCGGGCKGFQPAARHADTLCRLLASVSCMPLLPACCCPAHHDCAGST